jgi:membrane carboxypeptidase/penicillin-binding protein PbpC
VVSELHCKRESGVVTSLLKIIVGKASSLHLQNQRLIQRPLQLLIFQEDKRFYWHVEIEYVQVLQVVE